MHARNKTLTGGAVAEHGKALLGVKINENVEGSHSGLDKTIGENHAKRTQDEPSSFLSKEHWLQ
jgi:hypothetical protein